MKIQLEYPFNDYIGYIVKNPECRKNICLIPLDKTKKRTTISYARYLVSVSEKRILSKKEQVDHIDGNKSNDVISNLQILSAKENTAKYFVQSNKTIKMVKLECPNCGTIFERQIRQTHLQKNGCYTSCSRKCSYVILSKGYSISELKSIGENQVVLLFRK